MLIAKLAFVAQMALFAQPDVKIANGIYWTEFWLHLAAKLLT